MVKYVWGNAAFYILLSQIHNAHHLIRSYEKDYVFSCGALAASGTPAPRQHPNSENSHSHQRCSAVQNGGSE